MSSGIKPGIQSKPGQGGLPAAVAPSSQAILLDKLNRQSTPDSEALASSDDEGDSHRQDPPPPSAPPPKPVRRASWLNDTSQVSAVRPRKESFASSTMSPTTSHPSTPSADSGVGTWGLPPDEPRRPQPRAHGLGLVPLGRPDLDEQEGRPPSEAVRGRPLADDHPPPFLGHHVLLQRPPHPDVSCAQRAAGAQLPDPLCHPLAPDAEDVPLPVVLRGPAGA